MVLSIRTVSVFLFLSTIVLSAFVSVDCLHAPAADPIYVRQSHVRKTGVRTQHRQQATSSSAASKQIAGAPTTDETIASVLGGLKQQNFDPLKWKNPKTAVHSISAPPPRAAMLSSFVRYYNVIGMDKGTVHSLLGAPDTDASARIGCTSLAETYQLTSPWSGLSDRYYFDLNYTQGKVKSYRIRMSNVRSNKVRISHIIDSNSVRCL